MSDARPADAVTQAGATLDLLNGQADALRAELSALRQDLAGDGRHGIARGALLLEANEQLVLATLSARGLEAQAQEAHRRQVAFLAMVAHELRSPLMPLQLAGQMLDRVRLDERLLLKLQATILAQVAQISRLIGDLVDGSRIGAGKFALEFQNVEMAPVFETAIGTCRAAMEARHQQFHHALPSGPLQVKGDRVRLVQVFANLLDNACKYTAAGGNISLDAVASAGTLRVTVADDGIGITPEMLPRIFDLFVQDARAAVVNRSGLGIGLAVVRELVEAHGGTVVASSGGTGHGSSLVVCLPLVDPFRQTRQPDPARPSSGPRGDVAPV